jgi:uroporphyrinogen-III synthase
MSGMPKGLSGVRVACLESRRSTEMAKLVEKQGGIPLSAPSLKEVPLVEQEAALAFASVLERGACDTLILLTGVGAKLLIDAVSAKLGPEPALGYLRKLPIYCRGPKPLAVCRELDLPVAGVAPEPNTSEELLTLLRDKAALDGKRVFVQEYGHTAPELLEALEQMGATVSSIAVYAWTLPDDLGPLERVVQSICTGEVDAIAFTSAQQLEHLLLVAERIELDQELLRRLREEVVVGSIGPVTTDGLSRHGLEPDITPDHPKMGQLISIHAECWPDLSVKRPGSIEAVL